MMLDVHIDVIMDIDDNFPNWAVILISIKCSYTIVKIILRANNWFDLPPLVVFNHRPEFIIAITIG